MLKGPDNCTVYGMKNGEIKNESLAIKHSIIAATLLTFYGGAVCPFVDSLSIWFLFIIFFVAFGLSWLSKFYIINQLTILTDHPLLANLLKDFYVYVVAAILVCSFNFWYFDFPISSGLKILFGVLSIGIFASIDNQIFLERHRIKSVKSSKQKISGIKLFSVTKKLSILFALLMLITAIIISMVIIKDADYLLNGDYVSKEQAKLAVLFDTLFVIVTFFIYGLKILFNYSKNIAMMFERQIKSLSDVHHGNLQTLVPITTSDEFAHIAIGTNEMIAGLIEKERIRTILGKAVSPEVATKLIETQEDNLRNGSRKSVIVLFSDIRGFTELSEQSDPKAVLAMLNDYFEKMVTIVHSHGGIVDKFIGDAILAVFGIESDEEKLLPCFAENAVLSAIEMSNAAKNILSPTGVPLKNGFGIHGGSIFAGTVGSAERFEFTVIGDTVNTASRIEGLCKNINKEIIISKIIYDLLNQSMQTNFSKEAKHHLKGKSTDTQVFGYSKDPLALVDIDPKVLKL